MAAIFKLNPSVKSITGEDAFDIDGNPVNYDKQAVIELVGQHAYVQKRAAEYPSITEYLDGIVKGDEAQVQAYIDACLAVKAKYPK
jgi:hypothetical protein